MNHGIDHYVNLSATERADIEIGVAKAFIDVLIAGGAYVDKAIIDSVIMAIRYKNGTCDQIDFYEAGGALSRYKFGNRHLDPAPRDNLVAKFLVWYVYPLVSAVVENGATSQSHKTTIFLCLSVQRFLGVNP